MKQIVVTVAVLLLWGCIIAGGQTDTSDTPAAARPSATASSPGDHPATQSATAYCGWPFDAKEATRRQRETAGALDIPVRSALDIGNKASIDLVLIPAGGFMMGSSIREQADAKIEAKDGNVEEDFSNEGPQHGVVLTQPFYMGTFVVTQAQYQQVTGRNPSRFKGATQPVEGVSWQDAADFCTKLSRQTGRLARLPTEAEMEYAARSGVDTAYVTGSELEPKQANYDAKQTVPAGAYKPNAFGLYDADGNVRQWCADWYDEGYYDVSPKLDPQGPSCGWHHVVRGNGWNGKHWDSRLARRFRAGHDRKRDIGLRIVVAIAGPVATSRPSTKTAAELIRLLGDDNFRIRDDATAKLTAMGLEALPYVKEALKRQDLDVETQQRLSNVLKELAPPQEQVKDGRALSAIDFALRAEASPIAEAQIRWYGRAIDMDQKYAVALLNRGHAYSELNRHDEAIADCTAAIERAPEYELIHVCYSNRASSYAMKGIADKAADDADKAIELKPDFALAHMNRGSAANLQEKYDDAIGHFTKALELDPKLVSAYWSRGFSYMGKKQYDKTIEDCDKAIEIESGRIDIVVLRADAYRKKGQSDKAIKECTKAIEMDPEDAAGYLGRSRAYDAAGKGDEALKDCSAAVELNPYNADVHEVLARIHCHLRQYDKAWANIKACRKNGGKPNADLIEELAKASGRREQPTTTTAAPG